MTRSVIIALGLISTTAVAQDAIETDRPDQTETATTVGAGRLQFEVGFVYERDEQPYGEVFGGDATVSVTSMQIPTALVRVGITERFELRIESGAQSIETEYSENVLPVGEPSPVSGMSPLSIGFKVELLEEEGLVPQTAFIGDVALPIGSNQQGPEFVAPAFRFTMSHALSESLSLGYNLGAEWDGSDPNGVGVYTLTLARSLTDMLGVYVEAFGEMTSGAPPMHMVDGGFTFRPMPNLQFDISGGIALNDNPPDFYAATGVSIRLPD